MAVDSTIGPPLSWNERLVGKDLVSSRRGIIATRVVQHFLGKDMANTIVIKLLGRNIGFATLQNRVSILRRPLMPFQLMDIENGYFLAKF
ncbi:hypothetical protein Gogos_001909 [Gossypium gossypioides]|uniref:Uncharacterized protein n=1 Tax=Gossypium gossypioides TaxID=34282 RepID=A0A7J9CQ73_GOSGO|nr:hypothetical protein [Gossypium gossypioides]